MILYHYTAIEFLAAVERDGLSRGEVPITQTNLDNAVWLTTDASPSGHGLSDAGPLPPAEHAELERQIGRKLDAILLLDKRRVRISVVIPSHDRKLKEWKRYAKSRLTPEWLDALNDAGGGAKKADTWWLYFGTISPKRFSVVEVRGSDDLFHEVSAADRREAASKAIDGDQIVEDDGSVTPVSIP